MKLQIGKFATESRKATEIFQNLKFVQDKNNSPLTKGGIFL